ncbi:MAG: hypothetical protein P9X27_00870 [Candidatus Kaelpia aquatica]|nr:hypothetical protein [Candidatus Kaelpia aquatica]
MKEVIKIKNILLILTTIILISNTSYARRVKETSITLSTGLEVQKIAPKEDFKNPFQVLIDEMILQIKWRGKTEKIVEDIIAAAEQFLRNTFEISSQTIKGNIVPFSQLRRQPAFSKTYSFMTTFHNPDQGYIQIFINSELLQKHSDAEFVRGIIHEVLTFSLQPDEFFSLSRKDPEGLFYATETGGYKLLIEGFANFFTEVPFTLEMAKSYADALKDECFASLFPGLDEDRIELIKEQSWYRNAHPLGLMMFDVFSRINPEAMWEYALTFYSRVLGGDINLVSIASINVKEILYQDYVSLCQLAGEEPYPRYIFFKDEK